MTLSPESRVVYETVQKDVVEPGMAQMTLYEGWNFNSGNYLFTTDTK